MRGFGYPFKEEPWSRHASLQLTDYDVIPSKFTAYREYGKCNASGGWRLPTAALSLPVPPCSPAMHALLPSPPAPTLPSWLL